LITSMSENVYSKILDFKNINSDQLQLMADLIKLKMNTIPGFKKEFEELIGVNLKEYAEEKKSES